MTPGRVPARPTDVKFGLPGQNSFDPRREPD